MTKDIKARNYIKTDPGSWLVRFFGLVLVAFSLILIQTGTHADGSYTLYFYFIGGIALLIQSLVTLITGNKLFLMIELISPW